MSYKKEQKNVKKRPKLKNDAELTVRTILKGDRIKEYLKLKDDLGVSTDTEALRAIIRNLYKIKFGK
ncbi:MAG: hypothetical protein ACTSRZ_05840 [Promethearchaeota archaeon]